MPVIPRLRAMSPVRTDVGVHFAGAASTGADAGAPAAAGVAPRAVVVCSSRRPKLTRRLIIGARKESVVCGVALLRSRFSSDDSVLVSFPGSLAMADADGSRLLVQLASYNTNLQGEAGVPQNLVEWLAPTLEVSNFLAHDRRGPDVIAVGFQELLPLYLACAP
jgi:hypothetical protein